MVMVNKLAHGYLLLADISGFVEFLAGVELDHAHAILEELFELITRCLEPLLGVSERNGGALLAYAPDRNISRSEQVLEVIEATYGKFRDRLAAIRRHSTCTCKACRAVPGLELNFLLHYGEYILNPVAGQTGLLGLDVDIVRRRLIKDQVTPESSGSGYALITESGLEHLGITGDGMQTHAGHYHAHGEIRTYLWDLRAKYLADAARRSVMVRPEDAYTTLTRDFAAAATTLWDWLNDPKLRTRWMKGRHWTAALRPGGRTGAGARNHCEHGVGSVTETILDWKPFEYFTVEVTPSVGLVAMLQTYRLTPLTNGSGTCLEVTIRTKGTMPEWLARPLCTAGVSLLMKSDLNRLARLLAQDSASRSLEQP